MNRHSLLSFLGQQSAQAMYAARVLRIFDDFSRRRLHIVCL